MGGAKKYFLWIFGLLCLFPMTKSKIHFENFDNFMSKNWIALVYFNQDFSNEKFIQILKNRGYYSVKNKLKLIELNGIESMFTLVQSEFLMRKKKENVLLKIVVVKNDSAAQKFNILKIIVFFFLHFFNFLFDHRKKGCDWD